MTREEMRYKLNELRMMLNDGEHGEEQGVLVEIISELDKWEEPPIYTLTSNTISALSENKGERIDSRMNDTVKLIIEIPKDIYERCKEYKLWSYDAETLEGAVATSKPLFEKIRCNTCKNNDDELSGECYECIKGIFDHYEPEEVKTESEDKE